MLICTFAFCNCLYFNYCYCCCFIYTPEKKPDSYFTRLFILLAISTVLYIAGGVFTQSRMQSLSTYEQYTICQLISNDVYQIITGVNLTYSENKGNADASINWSGITFLNSSFITYISKVEDFRISIMDKEYLSATDPALSNYTTLLTGIREFETYTTTNKFEVVDPNGETDPVFNITYVCTRCQNTSAVVAAEKEINDTYYAWDQWMNDYREIIYHNYLDPEGWNETMQIHSDTVLQMRIASYKAFKFYNIVMDSSSSFDSTFSIFQSLELVAYIINAILCLVGIFGYRVVKNSITELDDKSEEMNYKGAVEREKQTVKGRWAFHLVINCNMFGSVYMAAFSLILILLAEFVFEGGMVMQHLFYDHGLIHNFTFVPHGQMIDDCVSTEVGNVNDYFNFSYFWNYYNDMINRTETIKTKYAEENLPATPLYDALISFGKNIAVSDFHSESNSSLIWDPNGEQINYFLYPLSDYKYITTRPSEVLQMFTDYGFVPPSYNPMHYTNQQKLYCTTYTAYDFWAANNNDCEGYPPINIITPIKNTTTLCYSFDLQLPSEDTCSNIYLPNCYINYYMTRYSNDNDFKFCTVDPTTLQANFASSSRDYFEQKVQSLLTYAKYEDINRMRMENFISEYNSQLDLLISQNLTLYKANLRDAYNYYINLTDQFVALKEQFIKDENVVYIGKQLDKNGIMKNTDCSFVRNTTKVFVFSRSLLAEEFFGLSIVLIGLVLFLLVNASVTVVIFLRLRTNKELSEIKSNLNTIKSIEDKERRYFFQPNKYIETEDLRMLGLDDASNLKRASPLNKRESIYTKQTKKGSISKIIMANKIPDSSEKDFAIIRKFVEREERDYDKRKKEEEYKKKDDYVYQNASFNADGVNIYHDD